MISAVLCTYNREKFLPFVLDSLKKQTIDKNLFEIIFVNNNSSDSTREVADNFKNENPNLNFKYFEETQQGLSFARNRGVSESSGNYITFVDDDAYLDIEFLKISHQYLEKNKDVIAIGGKILLHYMQKEPKWITNYLAPLFGFFDAGDEEKIFSGNEYPRGSNMTFKKEAFEKYGLFNTALGRIGRTLEGGEEKDLYMRIKSGNEKMVYLPKALVYHFVPKERTEIGFVKQQTIGVGKSEAIRVRSMGIGNIVLRMAEELFKWGASFVLMLFYLLKFAPSKGLMLLRFRYWLTKSFISNLYK